MLSVVLSAFKAEVEAPPCPQNTAVFSKKQIQQIYPLQYDLFHIASTCKVSNQFQMLTMVYFASLFVLKKTILQCTSHLCLSA